MLIKLSDSEWVAASEIRRLFLQYNCDDDNEDYGVTVEIGFQTYIHGLRFKRYDEAVAYLEALACAISEATRNEK